MNTPKPENSTSPPTLSRFLAIWLGLGWQSFGGGAVTLTLIRRAAVEKNAWLSHDEFNQDWALCQVTPGINLLGLTILLGKRVHGWRGVAVALFGLLLPSVLITLLITVAYKGATSHPQVQSALRGLIPATVGLGLLTAWQMAFAPLKQCRKEGAGSLLVGFVLLTGGGIAVAVYKLPVIAVIISAGVIGGLCQSISAKRTAA